MRWQPEFPDGMVHSLRSLALREAHLLTQVSHEELLSRAERLEPHQLPEPYRALLVHPDDMTGTLERFHGEEMALRVLKRRVTPHELTRQVELTGKESGQVAELGAIRINLECFDDKTKQLVIEGRRPLGGILTTYGIPFVSRPGPYFRVGTGGIQMPWEDSGQRMYGRLNQLRMTDGPVIADVMEILPPNLKAR